MIILYAFAAMIICAALDWLYATDARFKDWTDKLIR
jgi:hypothetical protein